jgi:hypothetical protein
MTGEQRIGKDAQGSGRDLLRGTTPKLLWVDWGIPWKPQDSLISNRDLNREPTEWT